MSHRHFCSFAGHDWQCESAECECFDHDVPMEAGDHGKCTVELRACPEHHDDELRAMGLDPATIKINRDATANDDEAQTLRDIDCNGSIGFCLWCGRSFYSKAEVRAHNADDMANCSVFQRRKGEHCMPPVLQRMFEKVGLPNVERDPTKRDNN